MKSFRLRFDVLALLCVAAPVAATAQDDRRTPPELDFDRVFAEHPSGRLAASPSFSPDGESLAYLWPEPEGDALWTMELPDGARRRLTDVGGPPEPEAFRWSPEGARILIEAEGDLWLLEVSTSNLRRLTETESEEREPRFSPDGASVAYVRDWNLHLLDLETGRETALTDDGAENRILNGTNSWVYWEEIWGRRDEGFWWSPDGSRVAYYRFDESQVESYPLVDFLPTYPKVEWQRYPKAGQTNPRVEVGVLELATGETTWMETGSDEETYLARVHWLPGEERLAVERLDREQDRLDLLTCDASTGDCSTLVTEEWPTWVNLGDETTPLADGRILWSSERSGWKRLYLVPRGGGDPVALTPEDLAVTSVDHVDVEGDWLLFTAFRPGTLGAARRSVHRLDLAGGLPVELAGGERWNDVRAAGAAGYWVHGESSLDEPTRLVVRDAVGDLVAELPATQPLFDAGALPRWKLLTLPGPDGEPLPAQLLEPVRPEADGRHPVIMYHYGGPGSQVVADRWGSRGRALWHKMMAERGYGVLSVDNGGSVFFGKRGEDRLHRRFGEINTAAQVAGVEFLKTLTWVDPDRIGLWGWSGGGSNTLYSVLSSPGTWAAAVAGAPVTDWRLYDTIWTERYLDHPDDNPEGYERSSATTLAANLRDPLLIVHGTADDNVHPQNTFAMIQKLIEAGVPFESAIYPRQKHGFKGRHSRHFYERMTAFFDHHLTLPTSPSHHPGLLPPE